jgi:hypothetical protein
MGTRQAIVVRDGEALIINSILKCTAEHPANDKLLENNEWKTGIIVPSAYVSVGNKKGSYPYPAKVTLDGVKFEGETTIPYIYSYGTEKYSSTVIIKDNEQFDLSNVSLHENTILVLGEDTYKLKDLTSEQVVKLNELGLKEFEVTNEKELTVLASSTSSEELQVKLINDIALENTITVGSNLVLDLNGHTITSKSSIGNGKKRSFTVNGSLTVKNGTIVKENPNTNSWDSEIFIVYPNASITLDSVTLESKTGDGLYLLKDSNVLIKDSTINTNTWCIRTDGTLKDPYGAPKSLKVVNSVLNASAEVGTDSG